MARELAEEVDPTNRKLRARVLIEALYDKAKRGSLAHFEMLLQLLEEDSSARTRIDVDSDSAAPVVTRIDISAIPNSDPLVDSSQNDEPLH